MGADNKKPHMVNLSTRRTHTLLCLFAIRQPVEATGALWQSWDSHRLCPLASTRKSCTEQLRLSSVCSVRHHETANTSVMHHRGPPWPAMSKPRQDKVTCGPVIHGRGRRLHRRQTHHFQEPFVDGLQDVMTGLLSSPDIRQKPVKATELGRASS